MKNIKIVQMPRSKFLEVECSKCKESNIVFNKSATVISCKKCNEEIVIPEGGKARILGKVKKVLA